MLLFCDLQVSSKSSGIQQPCIEKILWYIYQKYNYLRYTFDHDNTFFDHGQDKETQIGHLSVFCRDNGKLSNKNK